MDPERALAVCANITVAEWSRMDNDHAVELWKVFRAYILSGFQGTDIPVPAGVRDSWERCKILIDAEVQK